MTIRRKILISGAAALVGIASIFLYLRFSYACGVAQGLQEQGSAVKAARPLFDAVITKNLKVGETLEHAKQVLAYAGLSFDISTGSFPHVLQSSYRVCDQAGFTIKLTLDPYDKIANVDIHEFYTGP